MSHDVRPPSVNGAGRGRFSARTLAILLMVAGAACVVLGRVVFGDELLYMLPGVVIVFIGLFIVIRNPRSRTGQPVSGAAAGRQMPQQRADEPARFFRPQVPPGLRSSARRPRIDQQQNVTQNPQPTPAAPASTPVEPPPPSEYEHPAPAVPENLLELVIATLEGQGAQVEVETQRESAGASRGILSVTGQDGKPYSVMVLEEDGEVDVADVRALTALVASSGSAGGLLVSSTPFTQRAYDWASARGIRLVREDELGEISL